MPVKPAPGETIEQTTRTRVLPTEPDEKEKIDRPEIWEFVETLKPVANLDKPDYEFTLYRGRKSQRADEKEWLGKFYEPMRREVIQQRFGGGEYNVWLKVGPGLQLRYNVDLKIGGQPIANTERAVAPIPGDSTSQLLFMFREEIKALREELRTSRGGDLGLEAMRKALELNSVVFNSGATAVQSTLNKMADGPGGHSPNPMSDPMAMMQFLAQVKTLFAPGPTNSLQETLATLKLFKESGLMGPAGGGGGEKLTDKLVMGLVNQLPTLTQHFGSIMDGYRRAEEAKAAAAAYARGVQPPINVQPVQQPGPAAPPNNVIAMPAPQPEPAAPPENGQPSTDQLAQAEQMMQYIEQKIVEILSNQTLTPEEAAAQALTFIDVTDPVSQHPNGRNLIDEILQHGKMGLDYIFGNREILKRVPKDDRLEAFKNAFLEGARPVITPADLKPDPNTPPA
jgi:hypothetical protein